MRLNKFDSLTRTNTTCISFALMLDLVLALSLLILMIRELKKY